MADLTLNRTSGTPLGGQSITAIGAMGLVALPTVTVEGRAAAVTAWASGSVTFTTPPRMDDGLLVVNDNDIAVLVNGTHAGIYRYNCTRLDLALNAVRAQIAQISVDRGDYYTITASQIAHFQTFQTDTGAEWPQGIVYAMPTDYGPDGQDSPYGFYTGKTHCVAQFAMPLDEQEDWDTRLRWLMADLFRAIMLTREHDSVANSYNVTTMFPGKVQGPKAGALACATVEFDIDLRTRNTNQNSVTTGD